MLLKKSYRFVLIAFLALSLTSVFALAGCANNEAEEAPKEETPTQEEAPTAETHEKVELQIFAANSLTEALAEVQELYKEDHDWVSFADTQFLASGDLVANLEGGASADLLITASKGTMDTAEEGKLVDTSTRFDMFSNDLVFVAAEDSDIKDVTLEDIAAGTYTVAVGDDNVPAGNYAAQALSTVGSYVDPAGKTGADITGKDGEYVGISPLLGAKVGDVCAYAETGDVDVAIVYSSDVYRFGGVKIVGTVAENTHKPIIYPAAITTDSQYSEEVQEFLDWATTDAAAKKVWQNWGFELIG